MNLLPSPTTSTDPVRTQRQTRHPLASRTLSELQDLANAAEADGRTLHRSEWSPFDWLCLVQFILTLRKQPPWPDDQIGRLRSTAEIPFPSSV